MSGASIPYFLFLTRVGNNFETSNFKSYEKQLSISLILEYYNIYQTVIAVDSI